MANQRSTRVQRICKKLQTVKGVGWPAAWSLAWPLEILGKEEGCRDFFLGGKGFCLVILGRGKEKKLERENEEKKSEEGKFSASLRKL